MLLPSGTIGGFAGGLIAGLFTMLSLRPNAPSISWRHMSPTIRIWGISGPFGMALSGIVIWILYSTGFLTAPEFDVSCDNLGIIECIVLAFFTILIQTIVWFFAIGFVFLLFVVSIWFFTGLLAGRQVVRHLRKLEPGITNRQSRGVSIGWGCAAIVAAIVTISLLVIISNALGLS